MVAVAGASVIGAGLNAHSNSQAAKAQARASQSAAGEVKDATTQARDDLFKLFPASQDALSTGYKGAADMYGQSVPQQANIFQQGNVAAQQQILAGMPQFQNAILGGQVDYSQFQPTELQQPDFNFLQNQEFTAPEPFNPNYGMTDEQIQHATATQPQPYVYDPNAMGPNLSGTNSQPEEINMASGKGFLAGNKAVLENDPANRLLKKLFSDERLKEDIKHVGELSGHKLFSWVWKDTEVTKSFAGDAGIGFIAQEVEKTNPDAVINDESGYKKILISKILKGGS
jgi:hypothetical protein